MSDAQLVAISWITVCSRVSSLSNRDEDGDSSQALRDGDLQYDFVGDGEQRRQGNISDDKRSVVTRCSCWEPRVRRS